MSEAQTYSFEALKDEVLHLLESGLPPYFYYHNARHTLSVLQAALEIAAQYPISNRDYKLLKAAALLHDTGFLQTYDSHEEASVAFARSKLPVLGFDAQEIDQLCALIMATKMPQQPMNLLAEILCDADLDYLGRKDYFIGAHKLRLEWMHVYRHEDSLKVWYREQYDFLREHRFFTTYSRQRRSQGKQHNIKLIKDLLDL